MAHLCNSTTYQIKNLPNVLIIVRNSSEDKIRKLLIIGGYGCREYLGVVLEAGNYCGIPEGLYDFYTSSKQISTIIPLYSNSYSTHSHDVIFFNI